MLTMSPSCGLSLPILMLVAQDALRNEKRYYLHRTHVVNEIRQCCAYKTKTFTSSVSVFVEDVAKTNFCIRGVNAAELQRSFKNRACDEM